MGANIDAFRKELTALQEEVARLKEAGIDLIDFSSDSHKYPVPGIIRNYCKRAIDKRKEKYSSNPKGEKSYRKDIATYYKEKHDITLSIDEEICVIAGLKDALMKLFTVLIEKDDIVAIQSPSRSTYAEFAKFREAAIHQLPTASENNFLFDINDIPKDTKVVVVNYPNNPTTACATQEFLASLSAKAQEQEFIIIADESLLDLSKQKTTILKEGTTNIISVTDFSYRSAMKDYNIGWIAGDKTIIEKVQQINTQTPTFIQDTAGAALCDEKHTKQIIEEIRAKKNIILPALQNCEVHADSTHYLWIKANGVKNSSYSSFELAKRLLEKGIVVKEGNTMGQAGEGYIRLTLCPTVKECKEAVSSIREATQKL